MSISAPRGGGGYWYDMIEVMGPVGGRLSVHEFPVPKSRCFEITDGETVMAIEEDSAALLRSLDNQDVESQSLDELNGQTQLDAGWQSLTRLVQSASLTQH